MARAATTDQDYQGLCDLVRIRERLEEATLKDSPLIKYLGKKLFQTYDNLTIMKMPNGGLLIYKGTRVFIPTHKRTEITNILHKYHFAAAGIVSTAKAYMYWPNIIQDIETVYKQCQTCTT